MSVYDTFCYNGEEDILQIRMRVLSGHADYFVICESEQTFSGKPKPIYYKENWPTVIHIIAPNIETDDAFERAAYQKDYIRKALLEMNIGDDSIVYFGDVDEIWRPVLALDDKVYSLRQLNYSYYLNNRSSEEWVGTIVGKWGTVKTNTMNHWRANHENVLDNAGWHFTNQRGYDNILKKLESYDHTEFDTPDIKANLRERMEKGEDYVGRSHDWQGKPFKMWVDESQLPQFLIENKNAYKHLFK